ncbi:hypothetical protein CH276_14420, partial [Rhodococcus sp. 06-470-2]|uniref:DUF222 domain-containing protein n=1 Tax=unclassified Rhodococcus (in: high G+C Gram-positive bacteria) TaxID=192944 RepID=UPI000B9AE04D
MGALPAVSLEALTAAARAENRQAARKITACYEVHRSWITHDIKYKHYSRYGRTEMAVALGCSATVAESYISVGVALHTRLPLLRKAFETGEVDLPRVRTVCRILDNLSDDIVTSVEAEVVEAAHRLSPGPLEKEIWDILLRVAPEEAAALREFAKRFRTVTYTPAGELARIRAELTAPEAAAAWQLLEEMADTLCPKDPRGKKERLCDAFMARMHGEPRLACLCRREDCPKADAVLPDRRVPLTMVTVDIATLIGLLANPAYLAGHGSIDPDLARELARSSQWQILLTDAVTLAEKLGLAVQNPETGEWERTPKKQTQEQDPGSGATADTDTATTKTEPDSRSATRSTSASVSAPNRVTQTNATETHSYPDTECASGTETEAESCAATGTDTDTRTTPKTGPANELSTAASPTPAPSPTSATATSTTASPSTTDATATASAPPTAAGSASDPGTDPDRDSDPAAVHAASARGAVGTSSSTPVPTGEPPRTPDPAPAPTPMPPSTAPDRTRTPSASDRPEQPRTVPPVPGPPPPATNNAATGAGADRQRRTQSLTSAAALFCTHTPVGRGTRHSSALDLPFAIRPN